MIIYLFSIFANRDPYQVFMYMHYNNSKYYNAYNKKL